MVESWQDGTEWYRVYSDGWLEQGGLFIGTAVYAAKTYSFHKPFKDTNYFFTASITGLDASWFNDTGAISAQAVTDIVGAVLNDSKTTNSIAIQGYSNHFWYACGFKG